MRRAIFILLLLSLLVFGYYRCTNGAGFGKSSARRFTPADGPKIDINQVQVLSAIDAEYTRLMEAIVPSVVAIHSRGLERAPRDRIDALEFFFGGRRGAPARVRTSLGSGVIVSKEGHILTNHHVVAGMEEFQVQLTDGRNEPAQLIGSDQQTDLAVLKIDANKIEPLPLGDSDEVRVGQMVFAVGNPLGLQETVTQGIVSAKGRRLVRDSGVEFLQTDAAVNRGNSGGPLLNLRGEIIGINSAIMSETGGWAGISFAIPSNIARRVLDGIVKSGHVVRSYLGVVMMDLTSDLAEQFGKADSKGALVTDVMSGSPAEKAGIKSGDIIVKFNGRAVSDILELRSRIADVAPGTKVELAFVRDRKDQTATVEVAEAPADLDLMQPPTAPQPRRAPAPRGTDSLTNALNGIQVDEIPTVVRDRLPDDVHGVMVEQIQPGSPAAGKLMPGDIIQEIAQQPVRSVADYERLARAIPAGERVLLFVVRGRAGSFVVLTP